MLKHTHHLFDHVDDFGEIDALALGRPHITLENGSVGHWRHTDLPTCFGVLRFHVVRIRESVCVDV